MIAKKVPMRSLRKSDYGALVEYLTDRQNKYGRLGFVWVTNCQAESWQVAITEVLNTQSQNTRATADKTYHLIVSFHADEQPDEATLKAIGTRICEGLGYGEHQRICVVHNDTDNLHFHIAINKIHPTRYTICDPYNDHWTLGMLCKRMEREYSLQADNHQGRKTGSENRAADMEHHAGVQSLLGWIKRGCAEQMQQAQIWAELHAVMAGNGLILQGRGNGLVITDGSGLGVKASSVSKALSKKRLEERLGPYQPADELAAVMTAVQARLAQPAGNRCHIAEAAVADELTAVVQAAQLRLAQAPPVGKVAWNPPPCARNVLRNLSQLEVLETGGRRYREQPVPSRVDTAELYARYQKERQTNDAFWASEETKVGEHRKRLIESARERARVKRKAIKAFKGTKAGRKLLYGLLNKALKSEIRRINRQCAAQRLAAEGRYLRRS